MPAALSSVASQWMHAMMRPPHFGAGARWGIFLLIIMETLAWFMVVASLFALPGMRRGYQRMAKWIDGIAGTLFAGFGIHLIISR